MKRVAVGVGLAIALIGAGAACSSCAVLDPNRGVLSASLTDEKALITAEAAFFGANAAAEAAVDNGLVEGGSPLAVEIANTLFRANGALIAARNAYAVGDASGYANQLAAAHNLLSSAWTLIPKAGA
jgi:hypothetical protein